MKTLITKGGIATWINHRENRFIKEKFENITLLNKTELSEREQYIAQNLVSRGVLDKIVNGNEVNYKLNINNFSR